MKGWIIDPYLLAFTEAFLVGALPLWGIGSIDGNTGGLSTPIMWPAGPLIVGGILAGLLNGIRAVRTLSQAPPEK